MAIRDQGSWSIGLGRWGGVRVRLHMCFLLFAAFTLYLGWLESRSSHTPTKTNSPARSQPSATPDAAHKIDLGGNDRQANQQAAALQSPSMMWVAWLSLSILAVSVVIHELGHIYAARRTGSLVDQVVLWPLGGLAPVRATPDPHAELWTYIAGPAANLLVCAACAPLLAIRGDADVLGLLHPLAPAAVAEGGFLLVGLKLTFWINWLLVAVNLIPAFPFDGGRALRAALLVYWPHMERRTAALYVARSAVLVVVALVATAWLISGPTPPGQIAPIWFPLAILGIFMIFSAKHDVDRPEEESEEEGIFGYDFSAGYTSLERTTETETRPREREPGLLARWLKRRRQERDRRSAELAAQEESKMDDILERLHKFGMSSLSDEDKALLQRVSARYRDRSGQ